MRAEKHDYVRLVADIDAILATQMDPRLKCEAITYLIREARGD